MPNCMPQFLVPGAIVQPGGSILQGRDKGRYLVLPFAGPIMVLHFAGPIKKHVFVRSTSYEYN